MKNEIEKDIYYLVGQNIKKQRKLKGLTQKRLAEILNKKSKIGIPYGMLLRVIMSKKFNKKDSIRKNYKMDA